MPCIVKVHVGEARGLPGTEGADAYVEVRLGDETQRTAVCRRSASPVWREDVRFEVADDEALVEETIELRVLDWDPHASEATLGAVALALGPYVQRDIADVEVLGDSPDSLALGTPNGHGTPMAAASAAMGAAATWHPLYDTIRGAAGELLLAVRIEFLDAGRAAAAGEAHGVAVYAGAPPCLDPEAVMTVLGLVDVAVTEVDPDYHWTDTFRTFRSSNEASQRLLHVMAGRVRRLAARKAAEMGGTALAGFSTAVDVEPYAQTITVRALGTAVLVPDLDARIDSARASGSDSTDGESAAAEERCTPKAAPYVLQRPEHAGRTVELVTMAGCGGRVRATGGVVSAKAVRLMSDEGASYGEAAVRERWLDMLREDVRAHARTLGCNAVLGYRESVAMHDDVYLLAAEGTACRVAYAEREIEHASSDDGDGGSGSDAGSEGSIARENVVAKIHRPRATIPRHERCRACHLPGERHWAHIRRPLFHAPSGVACALCQREDVPEMVLATVDAPLNLERIGSDGPVVVEAAVCRMLGSGAPALVVDGAQRPLKRTGAKPQASAAELAAAVSAALPFAEHELYRQLQLKMRHRGLNGLFGLRYAWHVSATALVGVASGSGLRLAALPVPRGLHIERTIAIRDAEDEHVFRVQERVSASAAETHASVRAAYDSRFDPQRPDGSSDERSSDGHHTSDTESSTDTTSTDTTNTSSGSSATSVSSIGEAFVEIDDEADEDALLALDAELEASDVLARVLPSVPAGPHQMTYAVAFRRFALGAHASLQGTHVPSETAQPYASSQPTHHPSAALSSHILAQYRHLLAQGALLAPGGDVFIADARHSVSLVSSAEVQLLTTAALVTPLGLRPQCPLDLQTATDFCKTNDLSKAADVWGGVSFEGPSAEILLGTRADNGSDHVYDVTITNGAIQGDIERLGAISLQLFREIPVRSTLPAGDSAFAAFVSSALRDMLAVARGAAVGLGGDAIACADLRPAGAFYDNFKSQLHVVLHMSGDVCRL